jgi:hypothetical protein
LLIQGLDPAALLTARIAAAAAPLAVITCAPLLVITVIHQPPAAAALGWFAASLAYLVFWCAVCTLVAAGFSSRANSAFAALAAWALLVAAAPSAIQFTAEAVFPAPSRVAYLAHARLAEGEVRRDLDRRAAIYMAEHAGEIEASGDELPYFYRRAYLSSIDVNAATAPILQEFETQQNAQRRLVEWVQLASPATLTHSLLNNAAGAGTQRSAEFRRQVRAHLNLVLEAVGPSIMAQRRMSLEQAREIPEFQFHSPMSVRSHAAGVIWLLVLSGLVGALGWRRARRLRVDP